jgi:TPR repeat protein
MSSLYEMSDLVVEAYRLWDAGNNKRAFSLFAKAAERKESISYNTLGYFYDHGIGVKKNQEKALYWYKRAARVGDYVAQHNIGLCYLNIGNIERARFWLNRSVANGDEAAMESLQKLRESR